MKKPLLFSGLCFLVTASAVVACGDDDASNVNPVDAGLVDAAKAADSGVASTLTGTVEEAHLDDAGADVPIANAKVCVLTSPELPCGMTASDGTFGVQAPAAPGDGGGLDFALIATATGHLGGVGLGTFVPGQVSGYAYISGFPLMTDADATTWAGQAGFTYPAGGTAFIELRLPPGASATLAGATGKGPVYGDAQATPTPSLTAATASQVAWFGNVAPGPFTITVTSPGKTCTQAPQGRSVGGDWAGPTASSLSGTTAADTMLLGITMTCE